MPETKSSVLKQSRITCERVDQCILFCPAATSCWGSTMHCKATSTCICFGAGCAEVTTHSGSRYYELPPQSTLEVVAEGEELWYNIPVHDLIFVNVLCFIFCGCCCCGLFLCGLFKVSLHSMQCR